jgi:MFS superfamily sulfate permease-like transporter
VLAFLFLVRWRFPRLPGPLLAVLLATLVVVVFDLEQRGISVVGPVPVGLPVPALPSVGDLADLLLPALA